MELTGKTVNFLGDSITYGVGASAPEFVYHQVLAKKAGLKAANNYGISGSRIAAQLVPCDPPAEHDKYFATRVVEMADADIIVVFGGTNDYGHGDAPLGDMDSRSEYTFYGACHKLMQKLINKYPDKAIVFMTPIHRQTEGKVLTPEYAKNHTLCEYVHALCEVAEFYSIPVLDLYAKSGIQPMLEVQRELYVPDGLHPNDAGNAIIADKLEKFLRAL